MNEKSVLEILENVGVILTGHFVYKRGRHGVKYVDKDRISMNPIATSLLAASLASDIKGEKIEVVVAPAFGAITFGHWIAYHLSALTSNLVQSLIAVKVDDKFVIRPKDHAITNKRVLVVEDILHTGDSASSVIKAVRNRGGKVIGVGAICNRGGVTTKDIDVPKLLVLLNLTLDSWTEEECAYFGPCLLGTPINTEVGHGAEFLARTGLKVIYR